MPRPTLPRADTPSVLFASSCSRASLTRVVRRRARRRCRGYCHVPPGSNLDMTARIEAQIERFAPGFSDLVLARATRTASDFEAYNANYVGGDINGGSATLRRTTSFGQRSAGVPTAAEFPASISARHRLLPAVVYTACVGITRRRQRFTNSASRQRYDYNPI